LFKALIVVSLAMLACCAAAAWAGKAVPIVPPVDDAASSTPFEMAPPDGVEFDRLTFAPAEPDAYRPIAYRPIATPTETPELPPPAQAVIPLPVPLYAGAALLPIAWLARRAFRRAG